MGEMARERGFIGDSERERERGFRHGISPPSLRTSPGFSYRHRRWDVKAFVRDRERQRRRRAAAGVFYFWGGFC